MAQKIGKLIAELQNATNTIIKQQRIIETLQSENDLLSSTVLNNELGQINEERRQLQNEIQESKDNEYNAFIELQNYKTEFSRQHKELTERLRDVKTKQADIDDYIVSEAKELIKEEQENLQNQYSAKVQSLKDQYLEKLETLSKRISIRNRIILLISVYAVIITTLLIIWR